MPLAGLIESGGTLCGTTAGFNGMVYGIDPTSGRYGSVLCSTVAMAAPILRAR